MSSSGEAAGQDRTMEMLLDLLRGDCAPHRDTAREASGSGHHQPYQTGASSSSSAVLGERGMPYLVPADIAPPTAPAASSAATPLQVPISIHEALEQGEEKEREQKLKELLKRELTPDEKPPTARSPKDRPRGSSSSRQPVGADEEPEGAPAPITLPEHLLKEKALTVVDSKGKADEVYSSLRSCIPGFTLQGQAALSAEDQRHQNEKVISWLLQGGPDDFFEICTKPYGCKIVQRAVEVAMSDQRKSITKALEAKVKEVWEDANANFVLEKCIQVLPVNCVRFVLEKMSSDRNAIQAAKSKFGCRVLMRLIEHFALEAELDGLRRIEHDLIQEDRRHQPLHQDPDKRLINDKFANYVFQSFIEHHAANTRVVDEVLCIGIHTLSRMKFSSHVVSLVLDAQDLTEIAVFHREKVRKALLQDMEEFNALKDLQWGSFVWKQAWRQSPSPTSGASSGAGGSNAQLGQKGRGKGRQQGRKPKR